MITNLDDLEGTCYIEVLPGKYADECWNPQSVFFEEEHFGFLEPAISRHYAEYDHFAFNDIDKQTWKKILGDLSALHDRIVDGTRLSDIQNNVGMLFTTSEETFLNSESQNLGHLHATLDDFVGWANETLKHHDAIAVLGM